MPRAAPNVLTTDRRKGRPSLLFSPDRPLSICRLEPLEIGFSDQEAATILPFAAIQSL